MKTEVVPSSAISAMFQQEAEGQQIHLTQDTLRQQKVWFK